MLHKTVQHARLGRRLPGPDLLFDQSAQVGHQAGHVCHFDERVFVKGSQNAKIGIDSNPDDPCLAFCFNHRGFGISNAVGNG